MALRGEEIPRPGIVYGVIASGRRNTARQFKPCRRFREEWHGIVYICGGNGIFQRKHDAFQIEDASASIRRNKLDAGNSGVEIVTVPIFMGAPVVIAYKPSDADRIAASGNSQIDVAVIHVSGYVGGQDILPEGDDILIAGISPRPGIDIVLSVAAVEGKYIASLIAHEIVVPFSTGKEIVTVTATDRIVAHSAAQAIVSCFTH